MKGKMRAGIMLRIAGVPKTNRKMVARLPVQNAIGRPSMSSRASEPKSSRVSHAIGISIPTLLRPLPADQHDVLDELRHTLKDDQGRADWDGQFHRPVLHRPFGERRFG